jgi:hypothetical protein
LFGSNILNQNSYTKLVAAIQISSNDSNSLSYILFFLWSCNNLKSMERENMSFDLQAEKNIWSRQKMGENRHLANLKGHFCYSLLFCLSLCIRIVLINLCKTV